MTGRVGTKMGDAAGVTRALIDRARRISTDDIPDDIALAAKTCLLDWLGCALAGSREPLANILAAESATHGSATLIGREAKTSVLWAALCNGAASHALDYDDAHLVMGGHPSVPVAPAVLALAEERGSDGRALLTAFVTGVETECRLGATLGPSHYAVGFHQTATAGAFGAAAACAHVLGLDENGWTHAFGIAAVQASGLKSVFGSMSKPFQAGRAAQSGLLAARLAAGGFTSVPDIVETDQGFAATHTTTFNPAALDAIGDRFLVRDTLFKYHASCYLTQSAVEAALRLVENHKVDVAELEHVHVLVPAGHLSVCNILEPKTGLEGKFSLRVTVAMALAGDDTADPETFTDRRMQAEDLVAVRNKVAVEASPDVRGTQSTVDIRLNGGDTHRATADVGVPAEDLDRQWERLTAKFIRLAAPVLGEDAAWKLHDAVSTLETVNDVAAITELCRVE